MNKEAFLQLAGRLYDEMQGGAGTGDGRAPKYDQSLPAGAGKVVYASECSLKELQYQKQRADKPPSDPKWAESNAKRSKALGYWLAYRSASPDAIWTGERNRQTVTALPPSDRPTSYDRNAPAAPETQAAPSSFDDSDIPF